MMEIQMQYRERLQEWKLKDYIKNLTAIGLKLPIWAVQYIGCFIPVKRNRMIIYSLKQKGYTGNLKYLYQDIKKIYPNQFEIRWVVNDLNAYKSLKSKGIKVIKCHSIEHFIYRHRAQVVVTDDDFYAPCIRRSKQILVNVWHGGINYKKIGFAGIGFTNRLQKKIFCLSNPQPNIFVSGSRSFSETTSKAFHFDESVFLACGLPRNEVFFRNFLSQYKNVRNKLNINQTDKIVLYAPTFRKGLEAPKLVIDFFKIKQVLRERFGGEWKVLIRQHYFVNSSIGYNENVIDVSDYDDMQELLCACDVLISDYSSCMWDYSFTGKPCFALISDFKEYNERDRSFSIPLEKWPYVICQNEDNLYEEIRHFDEEKYKKRIKLHHAEMESYENANASQQLVEYIMRKSEEI